MTAVARQLGLGWDAVWGIERRAVARGLARRGAVTLRYVGVDEKSFQRRYDFVTVVSDLEGARVLFVADDRKRESLEAFWAWGLTAVQREQIAAIAMDMWEPYVQATRAQVPEAEREDRLRSLSLRQASQRGGRSRAPRRTPRAARARRHAADRHEVHLAAAPRSLQPPGVARVRALRTSTLKVARAWALKEAAADLWEYRYVGAARTFFRRWYFWATHSRLSP